MTKSFSWSYTALAQFEQCPLRYKLQRVTKQVKDSDSAASLWGKRVHSSLDAYLSKDVPLPEGMQQHQVLADKIKARPGKRYSEQQLALNSSYEPTKWFGADAWVRGVVDVAIKTPSGERMFMGDWKTGARKEDVPQLKLFAGIGFAHWPTVQTITTAYIWLKEGMVDAKTFTRDQVPEIWSEFLPRVRRIELAIANDQFPPKPSGLCRKHCPVGKVFCEHCGT